MWVALLLIPFVLLPTGYQFANSPKFLVLQVSAVLLSLGALSRSFREGSPSIPLPLLLLTIITLLQLSRSLNPDAAALLLLTLTGAIAVGFGGVSLRPDLVATAIAVGGGGVALVGVLESLGFSVAQLPTGGRPSATMGFRNVAANYGIGCLPFCVYLGTRTDLWKKGLGWATAFLVLLFVIYTRSRGAWMGMLASGVVFLCWAILQGKRGMLSLPRMRSIGIALAAGACVYAAATTDLKFEDASVSRLDEKKASFASTVRLLTSPDGDRDRWRIWSHTLDMVADYPLAGVGLGNWSAMYPAYDRGDVLHLHSAPRRPHNDFLWLLAELGLLALGLHLLSLGLPGVSVFRDRDPVRIAALCAAAAIATQSMFSFPREQAASSFLLFTSVALAYRGSVMSGPPVWGRIVWSGMVVLSLMGVLTGWRAIQADQAFARSLQFQDQEKVEQQLASAQESLASGVFDHRAILLAGDALYQQRRYDETVAVYRLYSRLQPNLGAVHNNLGRALNATEAYPEAQRVLERGRELLPNDRWMLNNLAEAYRRQGKEGDALSLYDSQTTLTADEHHNLGLLAAEADSFSQARFHYKTALELDPGMHEIVYSLAGIELLEKDFERAIESYETYLRTPDPNPTLIGRSNKRLKEAYSALGIQRLRAGDATSARVLLEHRRSLGDISASDAYALAMIYGKLSLFVEAEEAAREAIELDASLLEAQLALANALHEQGKSEAVKHYRYFIENWKGDPRMAGFARSRLGD